MVRKFRFHSNVLDTFEFKLNQAITSDTVAVTAAVNAWFAGGGGDTPEAQLQAIVLPYFRALKKF